MIAIYFLWGYERDIANCAGDNTRCTSDVRLYLVSEKTEMAVHDLFKWFKENYMEANPDKYYLLLVTPYVLITSP